MAFFWDVQAKKLLLCKIAVNNKNNPRYVPKNVKNYIAGTRNTDYSNTCEYLYDKGIYKKEEK